MIMNLYYPVTRLRSGGRVGVIEGDGTEGGRGGEGGRVGGEGGREGRTEGRDEEG